MVTEPARRRSQGSCPPAQQGHLYLGGRRCFPGEEGWFLHPDQGVTLHLCPGMGPCCRTRQAADPSGTTFPWTRTWHCIPMDQHRSTAFPWTRTGAPAPVFRPLPSYLTKSASICWVIHSSSLAEQVNVLHKAEQFPKLKERTNQGIEPRSSKASHRSTPS